jgi:N-acetylglucosaminyldiphosphoundecaprenol N-acetyl-beta-D-mannosaminyltransferase
MDEKLKTNVKYVDTLGFSIFSDDLNLIPIRGSTTAVINTMSPNSYGISTKDPVFDNALKKSDYLVLDGVYFAFASLMLHGKNIKKNQGPDVFYHFMERLRRKNGKVFFLGSSQETLLEIEKRIKREYQGIQAGFYSPPFKSEFDHDENTAIITALNNFDADVIFVGMTCPKQEKWAIKHRDKIKAGLIISIGNVFDWFAGTQKAIHPLWYKIRLAWLIRIFLRPEIFRRNIGNQLKLFADVLLLFLGVKKKEII